MNRFLSRLNLTKVFVIFLVGFVSRVGINYYWGINVFMDYLNSISMGYYSIMAIFVVMVNELFSNIDIKNIPFKNIISWEVFNITSIRKGFSVIISNISTKDKIHMSSNMGTSDSVPSKVLGKVGNDKLSVLFQYQT